jgi:hypothetical protein
METKEIIGETHNLLFYYPLDCNELHAQIYDKDTENVIFERIIEDEKQYELAIKIFNLNVEYTKKFLVD